MQRSTRLVLSLLAGIGLAGCSDQIVGPQATVDARTPSSICMDQPILYSTALFYCGELEPIDPIDPIDPVDPGTGGGGGGGGTTVPPFSPPPQPFFYASDLPIYWGGAGGYWYSCNQITHPIWGFSNDVVAGTYIYFSGIVIPGTRMNWGVYNQYGQRVATHLTQPARSNCVVHHEPEAFNTGQLAPGYYYLYTSYMGISQSGGWETSGGYAVGIQGRYVTAIRVR